MKFLFLILILVLETFGDDGVKNISSKQLNVLQTVRNIAKSIPDKQGKTYENTISAICLTESSAGKNNIGDYRHKRSFTKASLGPMQIRLDTARHVANQIKTLRWLNDLNDVQLAARLLGDIRLSAKVATYYVILLHEKRNDHFNAVSGYNGGMSNRPYYNRVMKNLALVNELVSAGRLT
ncbi:MAG: transglycosylase SLT domain-containing protein [Sulfuricurvum sp.]